MFTSDLVKSIETNNFHSPNRLVITTPDIGVQLDKMVSRFIIEDSYWSQLAILQKEHNSRIVGHIQSRQSALGDIEMT